VFRNRVKRRKEQKNLKVKGIPKRGSNLVKHKK